MPPFLPRKRLASTPPRLSQPQPSKRAKLSDALDSAGARHSASLANNEAFSLSNDDSDSSLSDIDSDEFEDVPDVAKPISHKSKKQQVSEEDEDEEDEDIEWEDAAPTEGTDSVAVNTPLAGGDIQITFRKDDEAPEYGIAAAAASSRKGPSKREKEARITTHQIHVQFLLWHNAVRNSWIGNKKIQQMLVQQLPAQIKTQVEKWRRASGLSEPTQHSSPKQARKRKGKQKSRHTRGQRDWDKNNQRLEVGKADLSHGDPLISLLKVMSAYWKKRFWITAPGLRKRGYETKQGLKKLITAYRNEEHDPEKYGEKIRNLQEFYELARTCQGSRDVGAQLFTALLRGLGVEARLVASLQPAGYGWTKAEQPTSTSIGKSTLPESSSDSEDDDEVESLRKISSKRSKPKTKTTSKGAVQKTSHRGGKTAPINLDDDLDSDDVEKVDIKDDDSLIDITPSLPRSHRQKYDRDVPYPIYWTEAVSPITNKVYPCSPLIIQNAVATSPEILMTFEPRGQGAERGKIVMAYVVAYSSDGTAKDVTTRYLKKQIWPGKTKGFRLPIEKVPIYNAHGKIKRYEDYDWFKHIMSPYNRTHAMRTAVDDVEDDTDLVRKEPEKKIDQNEVDTLQSLKSSADFVLERHLRREEALRPGSEPDRMFVSGKGDKLTEEPVYKRSDVERCLTAESWHKEGRQPKMGETPMKLVPVRAVTLTRKREAEEHERQTGQKQMQGLYSWDQTEYIIPPPIQNGIIPKNAYGNIDCFVPHMVPAGAVHIPLKGTVRICKKLDVDFAEAVTGFEFGNKRAVPVCTGVVVAKEHEKAVREAWRAYNEEQRKKEETKMEKLVLDLWRKFLMGLRIRERLAETYVDELDDASSVVEASHGPNQGTSGYPIDIDGSDQDSAMAGGFVTAENEDGMGGGFLLPHEDDVSEQEDLIMEHHEPAPSSKTSRQPKWNMAQGISKDDAGYPTPVSVSPTKAGKKKIKEQVSLGGKSTQRNSAMEKHEDIHMAEHEDQEVDNDSNLNNNSPDSASNESEVESNQSEAGAEDASQNTSASDSDAESDFIPPSKSNPRSRSKATATIKSESNVKPTRTSSRIPPSAMNTPTSTPRKADKITTTTSRQRSNITIDLGQPSKGDDGDAITSTPRNRTGKRKQTQPFSAPATSVRDDQTQNEMGEPSKSPKRKAKQPTKRGKRIVTSPYFDD